MHYLFQSWNGAILVCKVHNMSVSQCQVSPCTVTLWNSSNSIAMSGVTVSISNGLVVGGRIHVNMSIA